MHDAPIPAPEAPLDLSKVTLQPTTLKHLPLVREAIDQLGIYGALERLLPMDGRSRVSDADCVAVMILNILHGRVALFRMGEWLDGQCLDVLLGEDCSADAFGDLRLGGALDRIHKLGTDEVLSTVVHDYLRSGRGPSSYSVHQDATTLKLYGACEGYEGRDDLALPAHGHSKEHRPDLKQLVFGVTLHGAVGIPLMANLFDGNASDQEVNRWHVEELAGLLPAEDDVTLVADCKLVDPQTLGLVVEAGFHFVSLLPRSYALRGVLEEKFLVPDRPLPELVREPGRTKKDPDRVYRGASQVAAFPLQHPDIEGPDGLRTEQLRFLVVDSDARARKFEAALPDRLAKEEKAVTARFRKLARRSFECHHDAQAVLDDTLKADPAYHDLQAEVVSEEVRVKRAQRGRPRAGEQPPTTIRYTIELTSLTVSDEKVARALEHARGFVLVTDHLDTEAWPDERILREYRHQHLVEGQAGFRWFKSTAAVAPVFLNKPERIAALALVFVLALMVRNYIQFTLRDRLVETDCTIPDLKWKPTQSPTTETALRLFQKIMVVDLVESAKDPVLRRVRDRQLSGLSDHCRVVLEMLGMDESIFVRTRTRPGRKRRPDAAGMDRM